MSTKVHPMRKFMEARRALSAASHAVPTEDGDIPSPPDSSHFRPSDALDSRVREILGKQSLTRLLSDRASRATVEAVPAVRARLKSGRSNSDRHGAQEAEFQSLALLLAILGRPDLTGFPKAKSGLSSQNYGARRAWAGKVSRPRDAGAEGERLAFIELRCSSGANFTLAPGLVGDGGVSSAEADSALVDRLSAELDRFYGEIVWFIREVNSCDRCDFTVKFFAPHVKVSFGGGGYEVQLSMRLCLGCPPGFNLKEELRSLTLPSETTAYPVSSEVKGRGEWIYLSDLMEHAMFARGTDYPRMWSQFGDKPGMEEERLRLNLVAIQCLWLREQLVRMAWVQGYCWRPDAGLCRRREDAEV